MKRPLESLIKSAAIFLFAAPAFAAAAGGESILVPHTNRCENALAKLQFKNSGVITSAMQFQAVPYPVNYAETRDLWSTPWGSKDELPYLWRVEGGERLTPPSGMRSAVPLGGLGSGTIEPRADGSIADWNIFNHGPSVLDPGRGWTSFGGQPVAWPSGQWEHLVFVCHQTNGKRIYLNGQLAAESPDATAPKDLRGVKSVQIGALNGASGFVGDLDDVRLYRDALDSNQVQDLYSQAGEATLNVPLAGHWKLDGDATDSAGGLNGALRGQTAFVDGKAGRALRLGGQGCVDLSAHAADLARLGNFTLSLWVRNYDGGSSRILFTWSDGSEANRIQMELHRHAPKFGWQFKSATPSGRDKVQLEEALFGLRVKPAGGRARAWALRTQPPTGLPAIGQIEYAGAFPAARLRYADPALPIAVDQYAYCPFLIRNAKDSATPAVLFGFNLYNPTDKTVETSLLFNLPNHVGGMITSGKGLTIKKDGASLISGTMALRLANEELPVSHLAAPDLKTVWNLFAEKGALQSAPLTGAAGAQAALATRLSLAPGQSRTVTFVLAWHFPNRPHYLKTHKNYYTLQYTDAEDVAGKVIARLPAIQAAALQWQQLCFDNDLPEWFQDALVNSPATSYKTGFWLADGRYQQYEAFSCPNVEPAHIHFYGSLPYTFFFPELEVQTWRRFAKLQKPDGQISEDLGTQWGWGGQAEMDKDVSWRPCGDTGPAFMFGIYTRYLWFNDRAYLEELWPNVKKAAQWEINRCQPYGQPRHMVNQYDGFDLEEYDAVSYNTFSHLAGIRVAERMAQIMGDAEFAAALRRHFEATQSRTYQCLWNDGYFRAWWRADGAYAKNAILGDTLYGQLWAFVFGLGPLADVDKLESHLGAEQRINGSPYGLRAIQRRDGGLEDQNPTATTQHGGYGGSNVIWQDGSLDWATVNIFLQGRANDSLAEAYKVIGNWRDRIHDQWNYHDLTAAYNGLPWCNSHYSRQLIFWALPLALSGQQYDAPARRLSFKPNPTAPSRLPWFTPQANGVLERLDGKYRLVVYSGELALDELLIGRAMRKGPMLLRAGETVSLEN